MIVYYFVDLNELILNLNMIRWDLQNGIHSRYIQSFFKNSIFFGVVSRYIQNENIMSYLNSSWNFLQNGIYRKKLTMLCALYKAKFNKSIIWKKFSLYINFWFISETKHIIFNVFQFFNKNLKIYWIEYFLRYSKDPLGKNS